MERSSPHPAVSTLLHEPPAERAASKGSLPIQLHPGAAGKPKTPADPARSRAVCPVRIPPGQRRQRGGLTGLTQLDPATIVIARPKPAASTATRR